MLLLLLHDVVIIGATDIANDVVVVVVNDVVVIVATDVVNVYCSTQVSQSKSVITEAASSVLHFLRTHLVALFPDP